MYQREVRPPAESLLWRVEDRRNCRDSGGSCLVLRRFHRLDSAVSTLQLSGFRHSQPSAVLFSVFGDFRHNRRFCTLNTPRLSISAFPRLSRRRLLVDGTLGVFCATTSHDCLLRYTILRIVYLSCSDRFMYPPTLRLTASHARTVAGRGDSGLPRLFRRDGDDRTHTFRGSSPHPAVVRYVTRAILSAKWMPPGRLTCEIP